MSAVDSVYAPDPRGFDSFVAWAVVLTESLARYNVPTPVEGVWVDWGCQLISTPGLSNRGLPDPRTFDNWSVWAAQLVQDLLT